MFLCVYEKCKKRKHSSWAQGGPEGDSSCGVRRAEGRRRKARREELNEEKIVKEQVREERSGEQREGEERRTHTV